MDDICQGVEECVGWQLMEASCHVEKVAERVGSEVQWSCNLVWGKAVESALLFGWSALSKGMNSMVSCKDKLGNMDQLLIGKGVRLTVEQI